MKASFTLSCVLVLAFVSAASAITITEYEFTGNTLAPTTVASNVTVSNMTTVSTTSGPGSGFITDGALTPSGNPQYSQTGFANGGYFTFTIQADSGYMVDLTNFEFYQRLGSTGVGRTYALEYLINGGTPVQFGAGSASTLNYTLRTAPLSIVGETLPIEFRIHGLIADNDATTFRIDDVLLSGLVSQLPPPAPEPSTALLAGLGTLAIFRRRRVSGFSTDSTLSC